jgi:hypothetical protein
MWLPRAGGVSGVVLTATVSRFCPMSLLVCPLLVVAANHVGRSDFTYSGAEAAVRCRFDRERRLLRSIVDGIVVVCHYRTGIVIASQPHTSRLIVVVVVVIVIVVGGSQSIDAHFHHCLLFHFSLGPSARRLTFIRRCSLLVPMAWGRR